MLCFPTQIKVGTLCVKDHQVLWLEDRLGLMEIPKNLKRNFLFFFGKNIYIRGYLISRIEDTRESREINGSQILMGLQYLPYWGFLIFTGLFHRKIIYGWIYIIYMYGNIYISIYIYIYI